MTPIVESSSKKSPSPTNTKGSWLKVILLQCLLFGVGGSLAFLTGVLLGVFRPQVNPGKPLGIKVWELLNDKEELVTSQANISQTAVATNPASELTAQERQGLQNELQGLQAQLNALNSRTVQLESELGTSDSDLPLDERLKILQGNLQAQPIPSPQAGKAVANSAKNDNKKLKVTLPSDVLFTETSSTLSAEANSILDKIVNDLRQYEGETIRVSAHTHSSNEAEDNRELSFRRAQEVKQYLANALGEKYRLVVVGYGQTRPLVEDSNDASQQLNRRIEITVD
ncbi:MAG: OmpA family protein [Spirulinaceae cyanobacterium]